MMNERLLRLKTGAIDETRKLFWIFIYLWVLLSLFSFHKALILNEERLIYNQGFALINALALAKVVLVGEFFHVGDNLKNRPLIYPILFKSAVFAVILICFHIIEETLIGVLHGMTLSQSIPDIGGGKLQGILMVGIMMFIVLMPFFAFREFERAIGTEELRSLVFGDETKADAARRTAAVAVLVLALGGGWLTWSLHRRTTADYVTQKLATGSVGRTVTATGIVGPAATAPVIAHVSGVIQALECDAKMKVKAGQVCAKIDPRPYQIIVDRNTSDLGRADARFEKDKADLAQAKAGIDHVEALAKRRAISQKAIEKARKAYEQAQVRTKLEEATVGQLQAALDAAEINLGSTEVVSPIDGIVLSRDVKMGQTVAGGSEMSPLFLIAADLTVIQAEVSEKDIGEVKQGDKATFTVDSFPNRPFAGEVTQIRQPPQIYEHGATYDVVISAPNPDLLLEPGMTATIRIVSE